VSDQRWPYRSTLGGETFREELRAQVSEPVSPKHAGEEIRQSSLAKAQRKKKH